MNLIHNSVQMQILEGKISNLVVLTKLLILIKKYLQQCYSLKEEFSQNTYCNEYKFGFKIEASLTPIARDLLTSLAGQ